MRGSRAAAPHQHRKQQLAQGLASRQHFVFCSATGRAWLRLDKRALLNVSDIENVVASHIHCGAVGVNGPVGVTLFGAPPAGGAVEGTLAEGTITAADPGNACGWTDLASVLAAIESGNTYVNVHTNDGVAPTNTGPGDFPGGEIRGQIR